MIKLTNPYSEHPDANCFGCSKLNPIGLKLEFFLDDDELVSTWTPGKNYEGWHDVLHGGIQATLMDEIASYVVMILMDTTGVTYEMKTRYRKPVLISRGPITLRARLTRKEKRIAEMDVKLYDGKGTLCSESLVGYFIIPPEKARKEMRFPGKEAFFPKAV